MKRTEHVNVAGARQPMTHGRVVQAGLRQNMPSRKHTPFNSRGGKRMLAAAAAAANSGGAGGSAGGCAGAAASARNIVPSWLSNTKPAASATATAACAATARVGSGSGNGNGPGSGAQGSSRHGGGGGRVWASSPSRSLENFPALWQELQQEGWREDTAGLQTKFVAPADAAHHAVID